MTTEISGIPANGYPASVTAPSDGEPRNAASIQQGYQDIADGLAILKDFLDRQNLLQLENVRYNRTNSIHVQQDEVRCVLVAPGRGKGRTNEPTTEFHDAVIFASETNQIWVSKSGHAGKYIEAANPTGEAMRDGAFDPTTNVLVLVGTNGGIARSVDPSTWTDESVATPEDFAGVTVGYPSGSTLFVAVGDDDGGDANIYTSPDGLTWTERANPKSVDLSDVCWDSVNEQFVAVGDHDAAIDLPYIITSPDGITWTQRTAVSAANLKTAVGDGLRGVAHGVLVDGSDILVAVGTADRGAAPALNTTMVVFSKDAGVNWTRISDTPPGTDATIGDLTYFDLEVIDGRFVACGFDDDGSAGDSQNELMSSADGENWRGHIVDLAYSQDAVSGLPVIAAETHLFALDGSRSGIICVGNMESALWGAVTNRGAIWLSPGQ